MGALNVILSIIVIIASLFMIVTIMLQDSDGKGLGALGGAADTYFNKNKSKTAEGKLALMTKIAAGVFVVSSLLMLVVK